MLQELDGNIAVRLNPGAGQAVSAAQGAVVIEHAVVGQGERGIPGTARKGMVVVVVLFASLGGKPGVAHDHPCAIGDPGVQLVGREGSFIDAQPPVIGVGDPGGVGAPGLTRGGQDGNHSGLLFPGKAVLRIQHAEQAAHQYSTSPSTGSLT